MEESDVSSSSRVKCERCGSEIMLKNLRQHQKTQKCMNGGKIVRKEKEPATILAQQTCLDGVKFSAIKQPGKTCPKVKDEEEESDEDDFEDVVLDDLQSIAERLDSVLEIINAGFSALLGGEDLKLDSIQEEGSDVNPKPCKQDQKSNNIILPSAKTANGNNAQED